MCGVLSSQSTLKEDSNIPLLLGEDLKIQNHQFENYIMGILFWY